MHRDESGQIYAVFRMPSDIYKGASLESHLKYKHSLLAESCVGLCQHV